MTQRRALPKICIALGLPDVPRLLEQARREAEAGENFLEFRLDYLNDPSSVRAPSVNFCETIRTALFWPPAAATRTTAASTAASKSSCAFWIWPSGMGRAPSTSKSRPPRWCRSAAPRSAAVPNSSSRGIISKPHRRSTRCSSGCKTFRPTCTNWSARRESPPILARILAASRLSPKIPLVTLAMGESDFRRECCPLAFGAIYTYAAPAHVQGTASGQVNARQLRSLYRIDKFTKQRKDLRGNRGSRAPVGFAARA